jgi:predicted heme/steroid binding protein
VVNGDDVTVYGLFVEHYQKYDTYWTGENGRMYFYQNEKAYDVPTQDDWIGPDGNHHGWAAYRVADHVKKHEAWGVGVYSVFNRTKEFVLLENGIVTPEKGEIIIHYPFTVNLSNNGGIEHIINGLGESHTSKDSRKGSLKTLPESFNNVWRSEKF